MQRRLVVFAALMAALTALAIVSYASARQQVVSGKGTITGSGTNWALMIANTGATAIRCWRYTFPPGVQATGIATPPAGWQVGGNRPPPAPILGGQSSTGIPSGGSAQFGFITDKPFTTGARRLASVAQSPPGILAGSDTCAAGSDNNLPVEFGSAPPPKPAPKCHCKFLNVTHVRSEGRFGYGGLLLFWSMGCIPQGRGSCQGKIEVVAPKKKFPIEVTISKDGMCKGTCAELNKGVRAVDLDYNLPASQVQDQTFRLVLKKFCKRGDKFVQIGTQTTTLAYDENGRLDKVQSDLNANGKPDGDE